MKKRKLRKRTIYLGLLFIGSFCLTIVVLKTINFFSTKEVPVQTSVPTVITPTQDTQPNTLLQETEDAGRTYQDSTLYLGDSNTVRFMNEYDEDGKTFTSDQNTIGVIGMGVQAMNTLECEEFSTGTFTMSEAVKILQPERIIVTFGTNNMDGTTMNPSAFIKDYTAQLKNIQEGYPSVDLIVNTIPPISADTTYTKLKTAQIESWNEGIRVMCEENGWKFLNSYEALCDASTGYAHAGYMIQDGLHLSQKGLTSLFKYIRTHAYITDDDRPKPLEEIPTIIGPHTNLYTVNPLTDEDFDSDLSATPVPTATPTPEVQETVEPTVEPTIEPTMEPTMEPTIEPTVEATPEPVIESTPVVESETSGSQE